MLTSFFLRFTDADLRSIFYKEKREFYRKVTPVITFTIFVMAIFCEIMYRVLDQGTLEIHTSIVNWVAFAFFLVLTCLVRKTHCASWFVCPALTALVFYYLALVDYDGTSTSIYYTMVVGITSSIFLVVIFNEVWLLSFLVYAPMVSYYMWKTGVDMAGSEIPELVVRCTFCCFIYALIAYKTESLSKQAFLGKESAEKAFYRWLKIFETFPEGIALVRKDYILYANKSISQLFEFYDYVQEEDPYNEHLKKLMTITDLRKIEGSENDILGNEKDDDKSTEFTNPWRFILNNEKGATFELQMRGELDEEENPDAAKRKKFLTLNQVVVSVQGSKDKLFVVRDMSSMFNLQTIMYTKHQMNAFTEKIVRQIQENADVTSIMIQKLDSHIDNRGKPVADETLNEIRKMLYRIQDFEQVYNIVEDTFKPRDGNFNVHDSLQEIIKVTDQDLKKRNIVLMINLVEHMPHQVRANERVFRQVILNLIQQTIAKVVRSQIQFKVDYKIVDERPNIEVVISNSRSELNKNQAQFLSEFVKEEELAHILEADVDVNLKIALILSKQLGWEVKFSQDHGASQYTLIIPITTDKEMEEYRQEQQSEHGSVASSLHRRKSKLSNAWNAARQSVDGSPKSRKSHSDFKIPEQSQVSKQPNQYVAECLLLSCYDLVPLFEDQLGFKCDESFLEQSALNSLERSLKKKNSKYGPYKFIFADLDDPTLLIGRFIISFNKLMSKYPQHKVQIYACSSSSSDAIHRKCEELNVKLIPKPVTLEKLSDLKALAEESKGIL